MSVEFHYLDCRRIGNSTAADCDCAQRIRRAQKLTQYDPIKIASAEINRLTRERDEALAQVAVLAERERNMREALTPFAEAGKLLPTARIDDSGRMIAPDSTPIITVGNSPGPYASLNYGHLRASAVALEEKP